MMNERVVRSGKRHRLIIYTFIINRWWQTTLTLGLALLALAGGLYWLPGFLPQFSFPHVEDWKLLALGGVGGLVLLSSFFLAAIRKSAYVQAFNDHLRLVTPFLRLNISYRRFLRTYSTEMRQLFPAKRIKRAQQDILRSLASQTALVIEMTSLPVSRGILRLFLSPLFFPDKTPRLALLVSDWIIFSTEMESLRSGWQDSMRKPPTSWSLGMPYR